MKLIKTKKPKLSLKRKAKNFLKIRIGWETAIVIWLLTAIINLTMRYYLS